MLDPVDFSGRPFHFIGVGGIGMSALAYILANRDLPVSGSDLRLSHITQRLQEEGVHVFWHQDSSNLQFFQAEADPRPPSPALPQVICSTAIDPSNPEYQAAVDLGCPTFHRSDLLAALIEDYQSIAIAGTHGKTTTSSMIGFLLLKAGLDPTIVVGGEVAAWGGNARLGQSQYLVAEADESDGSLAKLSAYIGVVTNIELDHPDHYSTLEEVTAIFRTFANRCQVLVGCLDCPNVRQSLSPQITYSLNPDSGADYIATEVRSHLDGTSATLWERGQPLGQLFIPLPGQHNLSNALAAVAVGRHLGLDFEVIAAILKEFQGARRRFERRGFHNGILFVDDYAHHPSEIRATLEAARQQAAEAAGKARIVAVFQPHRYSRAATLLSEFTTAFDHADQVVVADIYSAGEKNVYDISGEKIAAAIAAHHPQVTYSGALPSVQKTLLEILQPGDVVLFLAAGNLNQIIPEVMTAYAAPSAIASESLSVTEAYQQV